MSYRKRISELKDKYDYDRQYNDLSSSDILFYFSRIAECYHKLGEVDDAIEYYNQSIVLCNEAIETCRLRGESTAYYVNSRNRFKNRINTLKNQR